MREKIEQQKVEYKKFTGTFLCDTVYKNYPNLSSTLYNSHEFGSL